MAGNSDFTARFKVDISDLKKNITEAKKQITLANATFKAETAGMEDWTKNADGLASKLRQLKSVLENQKTILSNYEEQLERNKKAYEENGSKVDELKSKLREMSANGVSKASQEYKDLETELRGAMKAQENAGKSVDDLKIKVLNQKAAVGKTEAQIDKYTKAEEDLGKESTEASKEIGKVDKSLGKVEKQSEKTENKLGSLASTVSKTVVGAFAAMGAAVAGGVTTMAKATVSAAEYADEINTLSQVTGMSTEDLQAYKYAAELVDVSLDTLTGSMAKNVKSMSNAASGSAKYTDAYKKLGVSVTDTNGNLRKSEDVYWETIDALAKVQNTTERDALAMQLFGKSAQELNPLISKGSKGIASLTKEAKKMGAVMSKDSLNSLNEFDDTMQRLKSGASAAKNAIGLVLLPQLQSLADDGVDFLSKFTGKLQEANGDWGKIGDVVAEGIGTVADTLLDKLPTVLSIGAEIVGSLGNSIMEALPKLSETAAELLGQLAQFIVEAAPNVIETGAEVIKNLINGIKTALPDVLKTLTSKETISSIVTTLVDLVTFAMKNVKDIVVPVVKAIPTAIAEFITALTDKENVRSMIDGFIDLVSSIVDSTEEIIDAFIDAIPTIIDAIFDPDDGFLSAENIEKLIVGAIKIVGKVVEATPRIIAKLLAKIPEIIESIVTAFGSIVNDFFDLGYDSGNAFYDGLASITTAGLKFLPGMSQMADLYQQGYYKATGNRGFLADTGSLLEKAKAATNTSRRHAKGGVFDSPTWGLFGEAGAEAIVPLENNIQWIKKVAAQLAQQLGGYTVNVRGMANGMIPAAATYSGGSSVPSGINFTQINNSPKALSRIEIYRQTKNILSLAQEVI